MKQRRRGLQTKWAYIVNSLQEIIPSYEQASSLISLHADRRMRPEAVSFAVSPGALVLDLGAGPGTMSSFVVRAGGEPVLLDASRLMLRASDFPNRVQATFENMPFRDGVFDGAVSGFALRDAYDLKKALAQLSRVLKVGGRFSLCDLGKPDSAVGTILLGAYMRIVPNVVGLISVGRSGLRYGSLFDTFVLTPHNGELVSLLSRFFREVHIHATQLGGSIVVKCVR
ncbi:MAG: methyltransferase domain-containing protein [Candidatus Gagatemarchaeaceae archaeon]